MATVKVEYCGMPGEGKTVTAARQDAARKAEAALAGTYCPVLVTWRGECVLVYREPHGWNTMMVSTDGTLREGSSSTCHYNDERERVIRFAQAHVAQNGWRFEDSDDDIPPVLTHREDIADFRSWVNFQRRAARAKLAGLDSNACHAYGCGGFGLTPEQIALVEGTAPATV